MPDRANAKALSSPCGPFPTKLELLLTAAFGMALAAYLAVRFGKGISWDQKNYHHYDVYQWLNGVMDFHFAPAGMHSWMNPLVYVPQYWLVNNAPAVVAGAMFGAWAGLNFALAYALGRIVLTGCSQRLAMGLAFLCAAVGFWDPYVIEMLGTTDADNLVSLPVVASLCLLCWAVRPEAAPRESQRSFALAGVLLGMAAGLKWTCFVYALGATLALVTLYFPLRLDRKRFFWFGAGGILGYLPAGGYWNWVLWSNYDNPFFPYWNDYFQSAYGMQSSYRDVRFLPESLQEALAYPFRWFLGLPTIEEPFRDARYALLFVLLCLLLAAVIGRGIARRGDSRGQGLESQPLAGREQMWLLLAFFLFSYVLWLRLFSIQRYVTPLGLISGLLLLGVLDRLIAGLPAKLAAFSLVAVFSLFWMQADFRSWRVPYGNSGWFGLGLPSELQQPNTLVLQLGGEPTSYVIAYLPESMRAESARAVRLMDVIVPQDGTQTELARRAEQILSEHSGPMRTLAGGPLGDSDVAYLKRFGLELETDCVEFGSNTDRLSTCALARTASTGP